ncbi:hypothetical protein [Petrachloros mirabilis]
MRHREMIVAMLCGVLLLPALAEADTEDLRSIIDKFVVRQFPDAAGRYWIINETQWEGDEMIVDMHAVVQEKKQVAPILSHFILLIVAGELKAVQMVPLEPDADCQPEQET